MDISRHDSDTNDHANGSQRRPKLRALDVQLVTQDGRPSLYLRDPLELSEASIVVPREYGLILQFIDGTHTSSEISAAVMVRHGVRVDVDVVDHLVDALDEVLLLDNERARRAQEDLLEAYRDGDFRPPFLAGKSYPAEPRALRALLNGFLEAAAELPPIHERGAVASVRGVISPHIDYQRGGLTYAQVWHAAREAARSADLAVILGTDHSGTQGTITLSHQPYATPFGVLPQPEELRDDLAQAVGSSAYSDELHHRTEHSVELSAVWLHHAREGLPIETVPVLVGPLPDAAETSTRSQDWPGQAAAQSHADTASESVTSPRSAPQIDETADLGPRHERFIEALASIVSGRRALLIASVDLSHVGPAFGGTPMDESMLGALRASDAELLRSMEAGDAAAFLGRIRSDDDSTNVCGTAPIVLVLRALGHTSASIVDYRLCPADEQNTSVVSICGMLLH
jgi:predicted class III extradiol MEMO1 family dioxygenase